MSMSLSIKEIEENIKGLDLDSAIRQLCLIQKEYGISLDKLIQKYIKKKAAYEKERARYDGMCLYEKEAYLKGASLIAGIDEAGRGPLAGPVVSGAVVLPAGVFIEGLNDSKKLSPGQRERLYDIIIEKAIAVGVGIVDERCIDEINILNATKKSMKIALDSLNVVPDVVLIDDVKLTGIEINQVSITKGDSKSISIAAASIVAKVTRDRIIDQYDPVYPQYGFSKHKGYGTKQHIDAIKKYGICPIHRVSFTRKFLSG